MSIANAWVVVYVVLAFGPIALWWRPAGSELVTYDLARLAGLLGFTILLLQSITAARWKWIERGIGLDRMMRWHRLTGISATILLVTHLILFLIYYGAFGADIALSLITPGLKYETLGLTALILLLFTVVFALTRKTLHLPYHWWKRLHLLAYVIGILSFIHAWFLGSDLIAHAGLRYYLALLFGLSLYVFVYHYVIKELWLRRQPYQIATLTEIVPGVRHITLSGGPTKAMCYQPGQCVFIKFLSKRVTGEWHPFTISSSPSDPAVTLSIKASGDWTSTLGQLQPGDQALLDGPYGRFSYMHQSAKPDLVYIAGGIGITPLRSMLRHCVATTPTRPQYLFYANRTQTDIAFRDEFDQLVKTQPAIQVIHVLSADKNWVGEKGYVTGEVIKKYIADPTRFDYYICGPKPMMRSVQTELARLGVSKKQMHSEQFALV